MEIRKIYDRPYRMMPHQSEEARDTLKRLFAKDEPLYLVIDNEKAYVDAKREHIATLFDKHGIESKSEERELDKEKTSILDYLIRGRKEIFFRFEAQISPEDEDMIASLMEEKISFFINRAPLAWRFKHYDLLLDYRFGNLLVSDDFSRWLDGEVTDA